ncbi:MAG: cobalamin B12-binding domain-containing protein [Bacillota bacterium]
MSRPLVLAATLGDCVHVAGVFAFLRLAEDQGYRCHFLGSARSPEEVVEAIARHRPDLVALSYRLTAGAAARLLADLKVLLASRGMLPRRMVFGGTPPVVEVARQTGLFERTFDGSEGDEAVIAYLKGLRGMGRVGRHDRESPPPQTLPERVAWQAPYPLIRHHFGLPSLEATIEGARRLAEARVLDVISIGPDQNAQESFFRPHEMDPRQDGAGGVPVRRPEDFAAIYAASRCGNYPLVRSYSGTRDLIPMARMLKNTVNLAWGAVPLLWYNVLDGRSGRPLGESIREAQQAMRWHAREGIPLEVNEAHHWSLRDAPDQVAVAAAFLAAYNAKKAGVSHYVAQYMFNTPPGTTFPMDLGKMLAKVELIESLQDRHFTVYRQTRTGLASLPVDMNLARGQLASSTMLQMSLRPHIVHVVAHCEAHHAATPEDIIEAVGIARGVIRNAIHGLPDMTRDPAVQERKEELLEEARLLLGAIRDIAPPGTADPWADAATLTLAVRIGLLDAPHLRGNQAASGAVRTRIVGGACRAVDEEGKPLPEKVRIARLLAGGRRAAT